LVPLVHHVAHVLGIGALAELGGVAAELRAAGVPGDQVAQGLGLTLKPQDAAGECEVGGVEGRRYAG
jgi:hypothetical protein